MILGRPGRVGGRVDRGEVSPLLDIGPRRRPPHGSVFRPPLADLERLTRPPLAAGTVGGEIAMGERRTGSSAGV
jgi:hypothetical protein